MNKKGLLAALVPVFSILLIDQLVKIYIKTHFYLGESIPVFGNWFILHFIENNGMSFGMEFSGSYGKLLLTLFRIVAAGAIAWYLHRCVKKRARLSLIIVVSVGLAGALGNIIDCMFYGMIFSPSLPFADAAVMFPPDGGYAPFLHGKVVDMLYFPIIETSWPQWMPWVGGDPFTFFSPVFNIADTAITSSVMVILVFQNKIFGEPKTGVEHSSPASETAVTPDKTNEAEEPPRA